MTLNTKNLLFKLVSAVVPLGSALLFGALGLVVAGLVIGAVGYLMWVDPDPDYGLKEKALKNLFGYATLGSAVGLLWILI